MYKILITGNYQKDYNRDLVVFEGLKQVGAALTFFPYAKKSTTLATQIHKIAQENDFVYLPSFTHADVAFVKKAIGKKPLLFDPLISRYLSKVFDYNQVWRYSPRALKNYGKDYFALHKADLVLADTPSHKNYYIKTFRLAPEKICVVPVGVDTQIFFPKKVQAVSDATEKKPFLVGFYGSFAPLQGVLKIAQAAHLLQTQYADRLMERQIHFQIIGDGFEHQKLKDFLDKHALQNFDWIGNVAYEKLPTYIQSWDLALGIFGESLKADLVVPNKVYHYLACKICTLTKQSPAMQELFETGRELQTCLNTPESIAENIYYLLKNQEIREKIAEAGYQKVVAAYPALAIGQKIVEGYELFRSKSY
ncbi:glycosyltransferase family protein [Hugenholtzia roseola]|uniref:glycosyltransferase family protein n=1 Tax=Hugenholtzia roseola TaxID=1002 RepID=UPI00040F1111|nr:glycosyltransferase [Hugenholtzia roseola]